MSTGSGQAWGLDRIDQPYRPLSGSFTYTSTGAGVNAFIIDTGIRASHGEFGGRALALRFGKYVFLTEERLDKAERFFDRRGSIVITFARFVEGLRQANGIIAGITDILFFGSITAGLVAILPLRYLRRKVFASA